MRKTYFNWSTGKDAALALYLLQSDQNYQVSKLVTTVNTHFDRVSMHGLRTALLRKQAESIGLPLTVIALNGAMAMEEYSKVMGTAFAKLKSENFTHGAYGDILLEDLREFRDRNLAKAHVQGVYPLWKKNTRELAHQIIDLGFRAITVTTSHKRLGNDFCGREYDRDLLKDLPHDVDPCGENGEFHTFVYDGPIFTKAVQFSKGETVLRDSAKAESEENLNWETAFWYCDLLPIP